jgi:hypothetical protein
VHTVSYATETASLNSIRGNQLILLYKTVLKQALNTYQQTGGNGLCGVVGSVTRSNTSSALEELDAGKKKEDRKEELAFK